jgi:hypothetical protein
MSEHENLKNQVKDSFKESFKESFVPHNDFCVEEDLPRPITQIKENIENRIEAESIGREFLEKLQPIVDSRKKLQEAESEINVKLASLCEMFPQLFASLNAKFDAWNEMKKVNIQLEREVLTLIKNELIK